MQQASAANPSVLGIHLEGPFLSPEKPGVHDPAMFRVPDRRGRRLLTAARTGVMLVTLAPEQVPAGFIAQLADGRRPRVARPFHGDLRADQGGAGARASPASRICSTPCGRSDSREPGPIAAALEAPDAWFGMIVDGHHVDPAMLRLALARRGASDAGDRRHAAGRRAAAELQLYGEEIGVRDGRCTSADGTLAGAALDMAAAVRNCVRCSACR